MRTVTNHIDPKKRRRRNCADRMRRHLAGWQRRRGGGDPAGKVVLQLLTILSGTLALLPPMPSFPFIPHRPRPRPLSSISSPPGWPVRTLADHDDMLLAERRETGEAALGHPDDEDRGPASWAREHGLDPPFYRTSRAAPTWSRLVKDLRRRPTKDKARELIELRVPVEAVEWLRSRIQMEDWQSLRMLGRDGATEDDIAAAALAEAKRWEAAQHKPPEPESNREPDGSGDPESPPGGLKP